MHEKAQGRPPRCVRKRYGAVVAPIGFGGDGGCVRYSMIIQAQSTTAIVTMVAMIILPRVS